MMRNIVALLLVLVLSSPAVADWIDDFEAETNPLSAAWTPGSGTLGAIAGKGYLGSKGAAEGIGSGGAWNYLDRSVGALVPGQDFVVTARLHQGATAGPGTGSYLRLVEPVSGEQLVAHLRGTDGKWDIVYSGGAGEVNPSASGGTWYDVRFTVHWNAGTSLYDTATTEHRLSAAGDVGAWTVDIPAGATGANFAAASAFDVRIGAHSAGSGNSAIDDVSVVVPEPATLALLGLSGLGMLLRRRR